MITFWFICGIFLAIALLYILPPLFSRESATDANEQAERRAANIAVYRDQLAELETDFNNGIVSQEQYEQDRDDFERRLLEDVSGKHSDPGTPVQIANDRRFAYVFACGLVFAAVGLYLKVGSSEGLSANLPSQSDVETAAPAAPAAGPMMGGGGGRSQAQIEANVAALAKRLEGAPNDLQGWLMLARSYSSMEKFAEASKAYERATALKPDDADLLSDYAFALAMANDRNLEGKPTEQIDRALKIDPNNLKALDLAGSAAFQAKNYNKALDYWQKLQDKTEPNSEIGQAVAEKIKEAKSLSNPAK